MKKYKRNFSLVHFIMDINSEIWGDLSNIDKRKNKSRRKEPYNKLVIRNYECGICLEYLSDTVKVCKVCCNAIHQACYQWSSKNSNKCIYCNDQGKKILKKIPSPKIVIDLTHL